MRPNERTRSLRQRIPLAVAALLAVVVVLAGCSTNRGPDYGADPLDSRALAVPPSLSAEPVSPHHPFTNLDSLERFRPGPQPEQGDGEWAAQVSGNGLVAPVPPAWTLGTLRAALLLQGVGIGEEKATVLRTGWLDAEAHERLGVEPPKRGPARYTLEAQETGDGGTQLHAQAVVRGDDDEVRSLSAERVRSFLKALRPAFGRRTADE